ncbi:MAG: 30S ribosomal protein S1 [Candidatus Limnocylindria bacterium]
MIEDPQPAAPAKDTSAGTDPAADEPEAPTVQPTEAATMVAEPEVEPTSELTEQASSESQAAESAGDTPAAEAPAAEAPADASTAEPPADEPMVAEAPVAEAPVAEEAGPAAAESEPAADEPAPEARPEPTTMAELLDHPEHEVKNLRHGDVVEGLVVRIDPDELLVDFGGKSEGVVSNRELLGRRGGPREGDEPRQELKVGDQVLVYVLQPESPEGHAVLSVRRAGLERKWRAMQERFEAGEIVEARVIDHNKGGLIVDLGVRGFVPISQIVDFPRRPRDEQPRDAAQEIAEKLQPFVGRTLRLKILEVNRKANRLILSEKVAVYEERREKRDELFSSLNVGQRVTGQVRSIAPFGVFVDLGGIDGLVHKSELSWNKVNNPETAYAIGEEVEAEVIDINHERGRISLSIRRLQPDPWQESVAKYTIGDVIDGTVTKLVNFGAFVRIEEGLEGLIHISELSNSRVAHPGDVVSEGQELKLKIISLDSERHRLGLSLKQTEDRSTPMVQPRYEERADRPETDERPPERSERTERPERAERVDRGDRRDRRGGRGRDRDYRPQDATAEPEEGIDNTMAAAFAESGLLDQFRTDESGSEPTEAAAEPAVAEAVAEEPATAEAIAEAPAEAEAAADEPAQAEAIAEAPAEAEAVVDEAAQAEAVAEEPASADAPAKEPAKAKVKAPAKSRKPKAGAAESAAESAAEPDPEEAPASSEPEEG